MPFRVERLKGRYKVQDEVRVSSFEFRKLNARRLEAGYRPPNVSNF